jgi:hypothetical protein
MIRIALVLACAACGSTAKRPTTNVADAVVGKQTFVIGVPGGAPTIQRWSGKGEIVLAADLTGDGLADAIAIDGAVRVLVGRPPHALGSAVAVTGEKLGAVTVGDLDGDGANEIVVHGRVSDQPPGSAIAAAPQVETFLAVIRGGARGLGQPLERITWSAGRALLPSIDVDGDRRADLVTYQCETTCTVSSRRALTSKLGPETTLATWSTAQRVVVGAERTSGYVIVAVEPQSIRTFVLERGALRELSHVKHIARDEHEALLGPVAVGDFDHDARLDVAVVSNGNKLLAWSDGRATSPLALASPERVRTLALLDLDRDGDDDLLVATDDLVSLHRGSPAGLEASPSWKASLH